MIKFWRYLEDNLFSLHKELKGKNYKHGPYENFIVYDPKRRLIHKPLIRDRIVHQLIFDYLSPIFEKRFIFDSYASRKEKGTHKAIKKLKLFCEKTNRGNVRSCWVLKCDIEKFFDNINHRILFFLIERKITDKDILNLIWKVLRSFKTLPGQGLPLGNLTSQLFANIYLQELDYFIKHTLKIKYYVRFNDDFAIAYSDKEFLESQTKIIQNFLKEALLLSLPKEKTFLRKPAWGVDFLGYVVLPKAILLRAKTKRRMLLKIKKKIKDYSFRKISFNKLGQTISSYLGALRHCSSFKLRQEILNLTEMMLN